MLTALAPAPVAAPALPELDESVAAGLGDEILLNVAATDKVKRVRGGGRRSQFQSGTSRAWTRGGDVD